jgi:hypothetical protein
MKILIATHKKYSLPKSEIFLPIHVGKENSDVELGIIGDDIGENISIKNLQYCELTAIYWAWKNLTEDDFIGLCHYRRYPSFRRNSIVGVIKDCVKYLYSRNIRNVFKVGLNYTYWPAISSREIQLNALCKEFETDISNMSSNYEMFFLKKIKLSNYNIEKFWSTAVSSQIFDIFKKVVINNCSENKDLLIALLDGNSIYPANIFIFKRYIFEDYCEFLFKITEEFESELERLKITPLPRTVGFLGEILTSFYISLKIKEGIKFKTMNTIKL